jgi:hypothetical protein
MDSQKFDSLVKTLGSPTSRRRIVKGAAVAGLGSLLAFGTRQTTEAARCDTRPNIIPCGGTCCHQGNERCAKGQGGPRCVSKNG